MTLTGDAACCKPLGTGTAANDVALDTFELVAMLTSNRFADVATVIQDYQTFMLAGWCGWCPELNETELSVKKSVL